MGKEDFEEGIETQFKFEKKVIQKLPKPSGGQRPETDVAVIDDLLVLFKSVNDVFVCVISKSSENEMVIAQLLEGVYNSLTSCTNTSFISSGITRQHVLDNLSEV